MRSIVSLLLILFFALTAGNRASADTGNFAAQTVTRGALIAVDLNYIRGWAWSPRANQEPPRIWLFCADGENPNAQLIPIRSAAAGQEAFRANPAVAAHRLEPHVGLPPGRGVDFKMVTPAYIKDGRNHNIYAFSTETPDSEHMLPGSPIVFNSNVFYKQEPIENLRWNARVGYLPEVLKKFPHVRDGILNPDAERNDNSGRTLIAAWTSPTNPFAHPNIRSVAPMTGLQVNPENANAQLGVDGGPRGIQAAQTEGTAIGISLAPRAVTPKPIIWGLFSGTNWARNAEPKPFANSKRNRIYMEGWFKHPYTGMRSLGDHAIGTEGTVFYYYTLQFADRVHERVTADGRKVCNTIWFDVRLYQDKFARPGDTWDQLKNKEGLAADCSDKQNNFGVIDSIRRPRSTRISVPRGSAFFSTEPYEGERKFAFELDGLQLERSIAQLNHAHKVPQTFSTNCQDYSLISYNIDVESWNPTAMSDARLGLSFRDVAIKLIPDGF